MNIQDQIKVMQHFANGGKIEGRAKESNNNWSDVINPKWDWMRIDYRIKKDPRVFYVNEFVGGQLGCMWQRKEDAIRQESNAVYSRKGIKFVEVEEDDEETI